jgi:hypothetical protein
MVKSSCLFQSNLSQSDVEQFLIYMEILTHPWSVTWAFLIKKDWVFCIGLGWTGIGLSLSAEMVIGILLFVKLVIPYQALVFH